MSDLETDAKPLLGPMIAVEGGPVVLDKEAQALATRWAIKTALMLRVPQSDAPAIPRAYYEAVKDGSLEGIVEFARLAQYGVIDPIGKTITMNRAAFFRISHLEAKLKASTRTDIPNAYGATFSIGYLVFQVFGIYEHGDVLTFGVKRRLDDTIFIWPYQGLQRWPPRYSFNDEGLEAFAKSYTG
jgi:hypothetical protein